MAEYNCNMQEKNIVKEVMLIGGMVKFISITTRMKKNNCYVVFIQKAINLNF